MNIFRGLHKSFCSFGALQLEIASRFIQAPKPFGNEHPFRGAELLQLLLLNLILLLTAGWLLAAIDSSWSSTKSREERQRLMESSSRTRRNSWRDSTKS